MIYNLSWIKEKFDRGETIKYIFFWGHTNKENLEVGKFVLSQWYYAPFVIDTIEYKTSEHWMMGQKALLFDDKDCFQKIIKSNKPGEAKDLGRQIKNFDDQLWNAHKFDIVLKGNINKFSQSKILKEYLIGTGDRVLVEASPTDTIWGIGIAQDHAMIENPHSWRGENLLGFALMETRDILKKA